MSLWDSALWLIRVSRPRFWTYVLGPFAVGLAAHRTLTPTSPGIFVNPTALLWALYFTLPANLLIYGVNDIFDYETDFLNAKKRGYEAVVPPDDRKKLWAAILLTNLPFAPFALYLPMGAWLALIGFANLAFWYSAAPIRAKARPFIDAAFNLLYVCPGFVAYFLLGPKPFDLSVLLAGWAWVMAMQLYSAVPDITADSESGIRTTATVLGLRNSLWLCLALYLAAALLSASATRFLSLPLGAVYLILMLLSLRAGTEDGVMRLYRRFPLVNALCGMALFFRAAL
jgi:4-hydroxybenzoate polyprenyltransferase